MHWIAKLNGWAVPCADNTTLDAGSGGDTMRSIDKTTYKTPVSAIDVGGSGSENLVTDGTQGMPTEGVAAENAAVAGNPVLTGGRYDSSARTLGDGDVGAIALDADGAVHISDGGNSITVDGSLTVDLGANNDVTLATLPDTASSDLASQTTLLGTIDSDTSALAGCVGGTELQVDIVSSATITVDLGANNDVVQSTHDNFNANANVQQGNTDVGSGNPLEVTLANGSVPSHAVTNAGTFATQATLTPATSGGLSVFKSVDLDETEEDVKTSAGQLYELYCINTNSSARYLKVYNLAAASVTVGSSSTVMDLWIPPASGFHLKWEHGIPFDTAICLAATTGVGDSDSGAPGANEVQCHAFYK